MSIFQWSTVLNGAPFMPVEGVHYCVVRWAKTLSLEGHSQNGKATPTVLTNLSLELPFNHLFHFLLLLLSAPVLVETSLLL